MTKNVGPTDKYIRIAIAVVAALAAIFVDSTALAVVLGIVAVIMLVTAFVGFCPLYAPFKINTNRK